ncbi:MAG TPA: MBL fold metallo-hydrolase [Bryobacteraceae bacterium]|jgi:L-ascorbate metabolism protein UlaG (beta-lactamase superfamily)
MLSGANLLERMEQTHTATPTLWWLGHCGFAIKYASLTFYVDPCLTTPPGMKRFTDPPIAPQAVDNADLILCTHAHPAHMDPGTLVPMMESSPRVKVVVPKSAAEHARGLGIGFDRMTTTDSGLRVEYFKDSLYGRVYSVPSAHPKLDWTPIGGYPYLGYLIRFEGITIYHAGDTVLYDDLALRLKPFNVTVAILPIGRGNLDSGEAAQLAEDMAATWLVPMHYGSFENAWDHPESPRVMGFIEHMLGHRPLQRFKVFEIGEGWTVPAESAAAEAG